MRDTLKWYAGILLTGLDLDPGRLVRRARRFPLFRRQLREFREGCDWPVEIEPRLGDSDARAASLGEYFWQDLYVARRIIEMAPERHIDVGSRVDGFIAHVACLRRVEVLDIRPLEAKIPNVTFHRADLMHLPGKWASVADCVTCLHSIEHFGLGRYGDPIDADGWKRGLENLAGMVRAKGTLILSTPVGSQRVKFNSHRIFHPATIVEHARACGLGLRKFASCSRIGDAARRDPIEECVPADAIFNELAGRKYGLGIFEFVKLAPGAHGECQREMPGFSGGE